MSRIRTNLITNRMANGAPTVSHGLVVAGVTTSIQHQATNINVTGVVTATTFSGSGASLTNLNGSNIASGTVPVARIGTGTKSTSTFYRGDGTFATVTAPAITTINNATNNRIVTSEGGTTVNSESNLTFDGTNLKVNSTDSGSYHTIRLNTTTNNAIKDVLHVHSSVDSATAAAGYGVRLNFSGEQSNGNEYTFGGIAGLFNSTGANYGDLAFYTNNNGTNSERLRITSTGNFGVNQSNPDAYHSSGQNLVIGNSGEEGITIVSGSSSNGVINFADGTGSDSYIGRIIYAHSDNSMRFNANGAERFRIGSDGKLYTGGTQFYPLVNYTEVATYGNSATSSTNYVDLRTIYSNYTPKKAGNRIVIHHQSQMWNGAAANSNSDVYWKIQRQEGGGSWTDTIKNERILGNHDGHSYTGGSGLARHHRTVHLMGSFICAGSSINLKTLGKSVSGISWDWYHNANNILQIWEYDIS